MHMLEPKEPIPPLSELSIRQFANGTNAVVLQTIVNDINVQFGLFRKYIFFDYSKINRSLFKVLFNYELNELPKTKNSLCLMNVENGLQMIRISKTKCITYLFCLAIPELINLSKISILRIYNASLESLYRKNIITKYVHKNYFSNFTFFCVWKNHEIDIAKTISHSLHKYFETLEQEQESIFLKKCFKNIMISLSRGAHEYEIATSQFKIFSDKFTEDYLLKLLNASIEFHCFPLFKEILHFFERNQKINNNLTNTLLLMTAQEAPSHMLIYLAVWYQREEAWYNSTEDDINNNSFLLSSRMIAAEITGNKDKVKAILEKISSNENHKNLFFNTFFLIAVTLALENNHLELIKILLEFSQEFLVSNTYDFKQLFIKKIPNLIMLAIKKSDEEAVKIIYNFYEKHLYYNSSFMNDFIVVLFDTLSCDNVNILDFLWSKVVTALEYEFDIYIIRESFRSNNINSLVIMNYIFEKLNKYGLKEQELESLKEFFKHCIQEGKTYLAKRILQCVPLETRAILMQEISLINLKENNITVYISKINEMTTAEFDYPSLLKELSLPEPDHVKIEFLKNTFKICFFKRKFERAKEILQSILPKENIRLLLEQVSTDVSRAKIEIENRIENHPEDLEKSPAYFKYLLNLTYFLFNQAEEYGLEAEYTQNLITANYNYIFYLGIIVQDLDAIKTLWRKLTPENKQAVTKYCLRNSIGLTIFNLCTEPPKEDKIQHHNTNNTVIFRAPAL
jgi:hypothetical protein